MSDETLKKDEFIKLLCHPLSRDRLQKLLKALPSGIPYLGDVYSSITTANQLEAVNKNVETILLELRADIANNLDMINEITNEVNRRRNPEFIVNSTIHSNGVITEYFLSVTLSNTGGSIIHVRKIWLDLVATRECERLCLGRIAALMDEYKYRINLYSRIKEYLLEDRAFSYKNGDIDKFTLSIRAHRHMFYYVQVYVEYSDVRDNIWKIITSPIYCLHFDMTSQDARVLSLLKIYKERPDLLAKEEKFQDRHDLVEYFQQNYYRFVEFPELFLMFKTEPDKFLDVGIDRISQSIIDRLRVNNVERIDRSE